MYDLNLYSLTFNNRVQNITDFFVGHKYLLEIGITVTFPISRSALATSCHSISSESGHTFWVLCQPLWRNFIKKIGLDPSWNLTLST